MKIIDLTHPIVQNMPVYPGTEPPLLINATTIEKEGFLEKKITLYSHTGTHIDAPAHIIDRGKTLDMLSIDRFYGKAFLLKFAGNKKHVIGLKDLKPFRDIIKDIEFILINTGWCQYWGIDRYFSGFPVLSLEAAEWLSRFELKGIGLDTISADKAETEDFSIHKIFLKKEILIIENLTNMKDISYDKFAFSSFPLKFKGADGSPVRAVALYND